MKYRKLGSSDLTVSEISLGSWLTYGVGVERDRATACVNRAFELGINFIDTANVYGRGLAETFLGEALAKRKRDSYVLATKVFFPMSDTDKGLSRAQIEKQIDASLKRLRTDYVDLYQCHRYDADTPLEETMQAFDRLVNAGKARAIGASNLTPWRIAQANTISRVNHWTEYSVVEQRYTYLRPRHGADFGPQIFISEELKDFARTENVALIGYSILLQGAYTRSDREVPMQFAGPDSDERLGVLQAVAGEAGCSPSQAIIAWMRQSDPAILPIIAGSRIEQLRETIAALDIVLSSDQMSRLDTAGNPVIKQGWIQPS